MVTIAHYLGIPLKWGTADSGGQELVSYGSCRSSWSGMDLTAGKGETRSGR